MALAPEVLTRGLALVRYLYELALQQSRQSGLRRATAILTFHDAVEMFLTLGLQHHDVYSAAKLYRFADYWAELTKAEVRVTQQGTMESLSRVRASFKHHAILPSPSAVDDARVHVRDFLNENAPIIFGVNFEEVSLVSAISLFAATRSRLENAEELIAETKHDSAIEEIAIAFVALLWEFEQALRDAGAGYVFDAGRSVRLPQSLEPSFSLFSRPTLLGGTTPYADEDLRRFAQEAARSINDLYSAVGVMSLGLDLPRYSRFKKLTPLAFRTAGGGYQSHQAKVASLDDCRFCFDFVVDSALRLQEAISGP